jgi:hypothetical protein
LRVTQLGTGNALLIEDSANPDATPFVVDASGNAVVGYTASTTTISGSGTITPHLQVHGTTSSTASIGDFGWSNAIPYYTFNKSGGAIGVYTAPTATTPLGSIYFNGADGSTFKNAVEIRGASDSGISAGIVPGRLTIHTTDTAGSTSERIRINSIGMGIGTTDTTYPLLVSDGAETLVFAPNSTVSNFGAQGSALAFLTNNIEAMRLSLNGDLGIGTTSPKTHFEVSGTNNLEWQVTASISGTTMTVTAVTSGTIAVGDLVYNSLIQPYTRVTALGTGTGGVGTYTVSVSQTVASATTLGTSQYGATLARITDTDGAVSAGQPTGGLQFYTSDTSSPTAGVGAYVVGIAESTTPDTALVFGTRDNTGGGVDANERVRIDSVGVLLVGYSSATATVAAATAITPRFQIHGSTLSPASVGQYAWSGTNAYYTFNSSAGAIGTYTAVASGDTLGVIQFNGTDNTSFVGAAQIRSSAEGTISTGIVPARLQFYTASSAGTLTERMRIDSAGYVGIANTAAACALDVTGGIQTSRTTVTSPATTDGNIFSGSYTPTFTNTTNISSSTPVTCYYTRVGNVVSVFGRVDVTATATGNTVLGVSLPIASNLTTNAQLSGTVATTSATVANNVSGRINGDTTNDRATVQWNAVLTTAVTYSINFSYVIV